MGLVSGILISKDNNVFESIKYYKSLYPHLPKLTINTIYFKFFKTRMREISGSPEVRTRAATAGAWVQSPVGELRSKCHTAQPK